MPETIQRSFTGGEIAPALRSRADLVKYTYGLALCENFIVRPQGGVYSRQGTRFITEIADSSARGRLIPFQFNTEQAYVLIFENNTMRVLKDGGVVLDGGSPFELVTPYSTADLARLQFTQSADVMTITHPDYDTRDLNRLADDNWTLTTVDFTPPIDPPTWSSNYVIPITGATQANPCVLTVSSTASMSTGQFIGIDDVVGMTELNGNSYSITVLSPTTLILNDTDSTGYTAYVSGGETNRGFLSKTGSGYGSFSKTYSYVVAAVDVNGVESLPGVVASIISGSLSTTGGIRLDWDAVADADYYRVYKDPSNTTGIYGWIGDSKNTEFTDFNIAPVTSDAPQQNRDPFAGTDDNPSCVAYYQQRRVYANTNNDPQTWFTSQTGIYNSMRSSVPARAADAITVTIASKQVNEIRHLIELDSLIILTSGGEYRVTEGQDQVLTPATAGIRKQSNNGSSWVPPAVINDTIVYVQSKGGRIRDINYEFVDDKYKGNDLSIMSEHLFENHTIEEMAYSAEPFGILWVVRDDGVLLGLTYQKEHQVWAWHHHNTASNAGVSVVESVTTIEEDGRDAVYLLIKRVIDGATVRYVERMEKRVVTSATDAWCVDCGLVYEGAAATEITGLDHLEGETLVAVADGNVVENLTVSSGAITLPQEASRVVVGLPYTPVIELLDIDVSKTTETLKGKEVSVSRVIIEVQDSRGGWVGPKKDDGSTGTMREIKPRFDSDGYDTIALKTWKEQVNIEPQWSKGGGVRIEQRAPLPMAILSVVPTVDVS